MEKQKIHDIISQMTLEEKASLFSGNLNCYTKTVERLNVPRIFMIDGPMGLRKEKRSELGVFDSYPTTCMPSPSLIASTFDEESATLMGDMLGKECVAEDVQMLLAPALNIKRNPLCGRNFEYYSEDPFLSGKIAASMIRGIQQNRVAACPKHFAANNQETNRLTVNVNVSERALREVYLYGFEIAVKEGNPDSIMCAYNKVNGTYCSQNKKLLTDILRDEWGFQGFVVSDWGAVDRRIEGLLAGLNLEMPTSKGIRDKLIVDAVRQGTIKEEVLNKAAFEILNVVYKTNEARRPLKIDRDLHHENIRKIAENGIVLLKNDDNILPILNNDAKILVVGEFANKPRLLGGGSALINPERFDVPFDKIKEVYPNAEYIEGFRSEQEKYDKTQAEACVNIADKYDYILMFCAINLSVETESMDRENLNIPECQLKLINDISKKNKNTIVILSNGGTANISFSKKVKGVLDCVLAGGAFGGALVNIISGKVNPSGRLNETIPVRIEDIPGGEMPFGDVREIRYAEDIFVGYRYYDAKKVKTQFPFGFGLSYTDFKYSNLIAEIIGDTCVIKVDVENTGKYDGKTVVSAYFGKKDSKVAMPVKQLRAFKKIFLKVGERKTVKLQIERKDFAYFSVLTGKFNVEGGKYQIYICENAEKVLLHTSVKLKRDPIILEKLERNFSINIILQHDNGRKVIEDILAEFNKKTGHNLQVFNVPNFFGQLVMNLTPLRTLITFYNSAITDKDLDDYIESFNSQCEK